MKKLFFIFLAFLSIQAVSSASAVDYDLLYYQAQPCDVKLMHGIDPYQEEEYSKYAWSPYPLFRTSSYMYFKSIEIPPGYYLLTPRNFKGKDYVLFKSAGKVQFIIPVVKIDTIPLDFYQKQMPVPRLTKGQKFRKSIKDKFYSLFKDSKKIPPPSSFVEVVQEGRYIVLKFYYENNCYYLAFRKSKY